MKIKPTIPIVLLLMALLLLLTVYPAAGAKDNTSKSKQEAADAYKKAYELILSKEYAKAQSAFADYIEAYADSRWYDDARYWYCYSLMQSTKDLEKAFNCYREFIKDHPDSEYRVTAEENAVIIAKKLSRTNPTYTKYLEELHATDEAEINQTLVMALIERGDEHTIIELYDDTEDPETRRWLVYALGDCESAECKDKLLVIAKTDKDPENRRHAIYALSDSGDEVKLVPVLLEIIKTETDPDIRRHTIYVLAESKDPKAVSTLVDIALTEGNSDMARAAVYALAEIDDPEAREALEKLIRESKDPEVKRAAMYSLFDGAGIEALDTLEDLALTDPEPDLRRAAVFAIADMKSTPAANALVNIFETSDDTEVRRAALYGMANFDEDISLDLLAAAAVNADDEELAKAGVFALVELIDEDEIQYLIDIYEKTPYREVRRTALHVILDAGGSAGVPILARIIKTESDPDLRIYAVRALESADDQDEAVKILADVARNDTSNRVRRAAIQVLGDIDSDAADEALFEIYKERSKKKKSD